MPKIIHRCLPFVTAVASSFVLSGCKYGSLQWNLDMPPEKLTEVAVANFRVGQPAEDVQKSLSRLDVEHSEELWPVRVSEEPPNRIGHPRLSAELWHRVNFLNLPNFVVFYFDDDFLLTQVWIEQTVPDSSQRLIPQ
ncbi:MAG: hypothetical protein ACREJD_14270 [Phycisphaerales bacterium]